MNSRKALGDRGEEAVAAALEKRGCAILERQYRCRWGEIDLIARSAEGTLCFVEVKTRSSQAIASPREAVTAAKQRKLRKVKYLKNIGITHFILERNSQKIHIFNRLLGL